MRSAPNRTSVAIIFFTIDFLPSLFFKVWVSGGEMSRWVKKKYHKSFMKIHYLPHFIAKKKKYDLFVDTSIQWVSDWIN